MQARARPESVWHVCDRTLRQVHRHKLFRLRHSVRPVSGTEHCERSKDNLLRVSSRVGPKQRAYRVRDAAQTAELQDYLQEHNSSPCFPGSRLRTQKFFSHPPSSYYLVI
eukprot:COSAG01_NODE_1581_length_9827_cov_12.794613_2_plen_110_part_00